MAGELGREGVFAGTVDEAVGFVRQGLSVHVVGPHGSGRSELLGLIADRLDDEGSTILRLFGIPAGRGEPFAALVAAGIGATSTPGRRRSAGEMSLALAQQLRGGKVVLVCDDADDLDLQTVSAVLSAHRQRPLVAVTTTRPHLPIRPDSLPLGLTPAVRLRPPVLGVDEVHAICRTLLGGPVDAGALARIATEAGGLAGLVRAIVITGRATGALQRRGDVWTIPGELWTPHLAAAVEHYLAGADHEVWRAAATLGVTGPVPLEEADRLVERPVLDRLIAAGLVHHSGGVVGVFPPLLAEYLRNEGPVFGRVHALDTTRPEGAGASSTFPQIGVAVGADVAVRNQRMFSRAAADVARLQREWQAHPTPESAMPLLVAMRSAVTPAEKIEHVVSATPAEDTFADAQMRSWCATWMAVDQDRLADALALLDKAADRLPDYREFLEVTRAHVVFMRDRVPPLDALDHLPDSANTELLRVVRVELLLAAGQTAQARALLADFRPTGRVARGQASLLSALAAVLHGDLDDGVTEARFGYQQALANRDPGLQQAHAYTAVFGLGMGGHLAEATHLLFDALSASTVASYRDVYHTGLLTLGVAIARAQGRPTYAAALAAQASVVPGTGPYLGMDTAATVQAYLGNFAELWTQVDDKVDRGYLSAAVLLAVEAAERDPDPARAARVIQLGTRMEGRVLPAVAAYLAANTDGDEGGLAAACTALHNVGAHYFALRADITRCLLLRRQGRLTDAATAAEEAWRRHRVSGDSRSGFFRRLRDEVGLSVREAEILSLLSDHETAADLARTLQMSTRTVERHIYNIGQKVGVSGREPLARAANSWLHFDPV